MDKIEYKIVDTETRTPIKLKDKENKFKTSEEAYKHIEVLLDDGHASDLTVSPEFATEIITSRPVRQLTTMEQLKSVKIGDELINSGGQVWIVKGIMPQNNPDRFIVALKSNASLMEKHAMFDATNQHLHWTGLLNQGWKVTVK